MIKRKEKFVNDIICNVHTRPSSLYTHDLNI